MASDTGKNADFRTLSRVLELLNKERARVNAPALALSVQLCDVAQAHARDMVTRGYFSNVSPEGEDIAAKVLKAGYKHKVAANLTMGPETEQDAVTAFLGSPVQRDNALDPKALHLGVGRAGDAWTLIFGAPPPQAPGHDLQAPVQVLELVNRARSQAGVMPLRISDQLNEAALEHARDMVARSYLSPRAPDGTTVSDRARRAGYQGRTGANVAAGVAAADLAVDTWMGNEQNRQNLLNPDYRFLGAATDSSRWVVVLGTMPTQANASPELLASTLALLNRHRRQAGAPELAQSDILSQAAEEHARDMVVRNYCGASGPGGDDVTARIARRRYEGQTGASFTQGHPTPEHALEALLGSAADKGLLLDPKFTQVGIGIVESRWVFIYGLPQAKPRDPRAVRAARMIELINVERARAMLAPLQPNDRLTEAAQAHAEDMVRRGYAGGTNPDGEGAGQRVTKARYPWRSLAELLATDAPDPEPIVKGWMQSAGHKGHLLKADLVHIGVGVCEGKWDVLLARPQ